MPLRIVRRKSTAALTISGSVGGIRVQRRAASDDPKLAAEEAATLEVEILRGADRVDDSESSPHRPLGIVLMRLRVTEIDQHPIAHVLGDKATDAGHRVGNATVVSADHLAQILGIEPHRQRRRADQIAEHDRELAALGRRSGDLTRSGGAS